MQTFFHIFWHFCCNLMDLRESKLGLNRGATCYTCKKKFNSQRGFENHSDSKGHFPVPQDYAITASTAGGVVVAATASTAAEVGVGSKGTTKFLLF